MKPTLTICLALVDGHKLVQLARCLRRSEHEHVTERFPATQASPTLRTPYCATHHLRCALQSEPQPHHTHGVLDGTGPELCLATLAA